MRRIWISYSNPVFARSRNRKEYRNRFLISGVAFHVLWFAVLIFSVLFLCFGPSETTSFSELLPPVFKDAAVTLVLMVFLGIELFFHMLNISRPVSVVNRIFRWFYWITLVLVFGICVSGVVLLIYLFVL